MRCEDHVTGVAAVRTECVCVRTGELGLHTGDRVGCAFHPDIYLLTAQAAAERWSSRPECSSLAHCQEVVLGQGAEPDPGQEIVLRKAQCRGLGLDLGLDKAGNPVVYGCGGTTGAQRVEQSIVGD